MSTRACASSKTATARAIVLALAGLERLGRAAEAGCALDPRSCPRRGKGMLPLEARADDAATRAALDAIHDPHVAACLAAERAMARALGASCHTPLGAHATLADDGA